ncbi:hypothetical protein A3844_04305 [Paenibacillus helianthi]|uniref:Glycosyl transferase family 28 C-terminal domain-containing protein n=1 Tax=Paenibacillus helianthi TaxID=1349432 RepID=A0ABX3ET07_9BACL|nr:hypothetical protein [Paenibacillus helianthi]OKP91070.1 hypothetical protein A3844_04305 [Paenibacillus helianthi]
MKTILCTAASFGYGPSGKLLSICKSLKSQGFELKLVADGLVLQLANLTDYFTDIIEFDFINSVLIEHNKLTNAFKEADLMLNVLEPDAVKFANHFGVKTVYVDSLFWMWDKLPDDLQDVEYIIQKFPGVYTKISEFNANSANFRFCGPIVDTSFINVGERENFLLVSFAGLESPFNKFGKGLFYPEAVLSNLIEPLNNSSYEKIMITGNSSVIEFFKQKYGKQFRGEFIHLSHDKFLQSLAICKMLIASPGLTTTYEALVYKTPIRYLPPQNYSQALMLNRYEQEGFTDMSLNWSDIYTEYIIPANLPEAEGVALVGRTIECFSVDQGAQMFAKVRLSEILNVEPPSSERQRTVLGEELTDGTAEVVEIIQDVFSYNA